MARRKQSGLISIRKPRVTIGKKGVRVTAPSVRIGKKAGINLSKRGISASYRSKHGTLNSTKGCSRKLGMLHVLPLLLALAARFLGAAVDRPQDDR